MEDELACLRSIVLNLAESPVFHSTEAGESFCGVCHSTRDYAGLIAHEDRCAYLAALAYKGELDEESDRHWNEKHAPA